ncbi:hypothetical protein Ga0123462_1045 [Mariprofundus ferrinatatus]|uniref:Uncharacterized protein n=1 Tax=Mariprofundus ferrinatatus TaxID=1921087 RepID=A0A2K8L478_9PROT|nr:hypothetical protein [Mariprofundus ferrinatatus]ATX81912.1 hypothetical protein Ga0123462_1045 [Mariprofundus ferrinatatus]
MNPENLSADALTIFNNLPAELQRQAIALCESHSEDEAVYLIALRNMNERERRKFLFRLSRNRWGL